MLLTTGTLQPESQETQTSNRKRKPKDLDEGDLSAINTKFGAQYDLREVKRVDIFDAVRGNVFFDVGDILYKKDTDQYYRIRKIWETKERIHIAKLVSFAKYENDPDTGIDFALETYSGQMYEKLEETEEQPLIHALKDRCVYFLASLRFKMDFEWLEAHINGDP